MLYENERDAVTWNPWHGCKKCSTGCKNCFVFAMDKQYGRDTSEIRKVKTNFYLPRHRGRDGRYKHKEGTIFRLCFTSDFFLEEADEWREECWALIKERSDCMFVLTTKRPERIKECLPANWCNGWDNVSMSVSCENQEMADVRIPLLLSVPLKHRQVFLSPLLEYVDVKPYIVEKGIDRVCVGGESCPDARPCLLEWVARIYKDCRALGTNFYFHQTGSNFQCEDMRYGGSISLSQQQYAARIVEEELRRELG